MLAVALSGVGDFIVIGDSREVERLPAADLSLVGDFSVTGFCVAFGSSVEASLVLGRCLLLVECLLFIECLAEIVSLPALGSWLSMDWTGSRGWR